MEILMALDCLLNAVLRGWYHETLSSRAWRAWCTGRVFGQVFRPAIDVLMIWQTWRMDHCQRHYDAEVARAELITKVRGTK